MATDIFGNKMNDDPFKATEDTLRTSLGLGADNQRAIQLSQQSTRAVGESKAQSLLGNVQLLRQDVGALRRTGEDVFRVQMQEAQQRTASAKASYLGSGVLIKGSAAQVASNIQTQSYREAIARRQQYEFQANRTQMQSDIMEHQAGLERQAAEFEAQSIAATAQSRAKQELASFLVRNQGAFAALQEKSGAVDKFFAGLDPFTGSRGSSLTLQSQLTSADEVNLRQYQVAQKLYKEL